jgi:hypothetical protein
LTPIRIPLLLLAGLTLGCQSVAEEVPAWVSVPSTQTQATLQSAMTRLLGGGPIRLAPDAFARSSLLTLEHAAPRHGASATAGSLIVEKPEQFKLALTGSQCLLIRVKTAERTPLGQLKCRPAPTSTR